MDEISSKITIKKLMENIMLEEDVLHIDPQIVGRKWLVAFAKDENIIEYSIITDTQDIKFLQELKTYATTINSGVKVYKENDNNMVCFAKEGVFIGAIKESVKKYFS